MMKIAVPFEQGEIFQHFGRTETFKVYDVEDNKVVACDTVNYEGQGHSAMAEFLKEQGVSLVICGNIGDGMQAALAEAGIELCAGADGSADDAVGDYLRGELTAQEASCDCENDDEGCGCGCGCGGEEGCGCGGDCGSEEEGCGGCGGCGGGCHRPMPVYTNSGKTCSVHYTGTFNDGTKFDSSYDRGEPLEFVCGAGMMIPGFDAAVGEMVVGQKVNIHLMPEEAYGMVDPNAIFTLEIARLPGAENLTVGQHVYLTNAFGQPFPVHVTAMDEKNITFDANHEMAGKELNFEIELVEIK